MFKKYMRVFAMILAFIPASIFAQSATKLYIEDFSINPGETKSVDIIMDNPDIEVWQAQLDVRMPEGLSVVKEDGDLIIDLVRNSNRNKHTLEANETQGVVRILVTTAGDKSIQGNSGTFITMEVKADANFAGGVIKLENMKLVPLEGSSVVPPVSECNVTTVAPSKVTIKADDKTMLYGEAVPQLTYTVTEGEADGTPVLSTEANSQSPVGTYAIDIANGTLKNDIIDLIPGTLTINKAPLTITARSFTITQGEPLPAFAADYSGFKNNETEAVLTTKPTFSCSAANSDLPGVYDIIVSGADAQNYEISYVAGKLTISEKVPTSVTLKADDKTMVYGDAVPQLTYTVTEGEADGEPVLGTDATSQSPVGTYAINIANGTLKNDVINLTPGTLTINKAPLTVLARSYTIKKGDALPEFEVDYRGFKNSDDESVLTKKAVVVCSVADSNVPGIYEITVSGAEAYNYDFVYYSGTLTIENAEFQTEEGVTYVVQEDNSAAFAGDAVSTAATYEVPQTVEYEGVTYTVSAINEGAFQNNTALTEVTIPETVTTIGASAFAGCSSLTSITVQATYPPTLQESANAPRRASSVFSGVDMDLCTLYVPVGSVIYYQSAEGWRDFLHIEEIGASGIQGVFVGAADKPFDVYDAAGRKVRQQATSLEGLAKGVYIVNGKKIVKK